MSYSNGDIVVVPFPFVTTAGMKQKARPALVVSNHNIKRRFDDLILIAITSQHVA
jgi:mRNA-degrading endonuclease toxin of MazEF toxin-antitoxin module